MRVIVITIVEAILGLTGAVVGASDCACATLSVHIRDGPGASHNILSTLIPPHCVPYKGEQKLSEGLTWAKVSYNGKDGWIAVNWIAIRTCGTTPTKDAHGSYGDVRLPGCPHIVTRAEWGARNSQGGPWPLTQIPKGIFIHHSATGSCYNQQSCAAEVRSFQNYHMDSKHWGDVAYSFIVGEDGDVYEGRGWNQIGAHTYGHNHDALGFCVIGTFTGHLPNDAALSAVRRLIDCAVQNGKVIKNYSLKGHRDVSSTECPGQKLYDLIRTWPHYG
ncbi:peptidoglycan-recognition protein SD-like isoform X2 [Liolophura sinensis]